MTAQIWIGRLARLAAVVSVIAIVALSLVPGEFRPSTGFGKTFEHGAAYCIAAILLTAAGDMARSRVALPALAALAGVLEIGQTWVHAREPSLADFLVSAAGVLVGGALAALILARFVTPSARAAARGRVERSAKTSYGD